MKKTFLALILAIPTLFCCWYPSSNRYYYEDDSPVEGRVLVTEERHPGKFTAVAHAGSFDVTYIQSNETRVLVEGTQEHLDRFVSEVKGNTLNLHMMKGNYRNLSISVTIYSPDITEVSLAGSGDFYDMEGHETASKVKYRSAGSGDIQIGSLKCSSFTVNTSGSGRISARSINCEDATFSSAGSGGITINNLKADGDVSLRLGGSGFGLLDEVDIDGDLSLSISGSGSIKVNGKAGDVNASIAGSGSIMGHLEHSHLSTSIAGSGSIRL